MKNHWEKHWQTLPGEVDAPKGKLERLSIGEMAKSGYYRRVPPRWFLVDQSYEVKQYHADVYKIIE